ncbi:MAG: gamma-glutamylcyclotransferase [Ruminococcus sp.]|nr:gamma-glutamylcyclotransferase [Ruminococcus sp.]MCM1480408.1 gamma-glutamylcyclotransferase [Muribaculaceae bacterium]
MEKRYYLAYGSNLNMAQMKFRCPTAKPVGTAVIENNVLTFRGSGSGYYLTIEPKIGGKVPVGVWEVTAADEAALDRYEGYPRFYFKSEITLDVTPLGGANPQKVKAFVYFMRDSGLGLPSDGYFQICLEGYEDFGLDKRVLRRTLARVRRVLDERKSKRQG